MYKYVRLTEAAAHEWSVAEQLAQAGAGVPGPFVPGSGACYLWRRITLSPAARNPSASDLPRISRERAFTSPVRFSWRCEIV